MSQESDCIVHASMVQMVHRLKRQHYSLLLQEATIHTYSRLLVFV